MVATFFYESSPLPFFVPARLHGYRGRVGNLDVIELRRSSKFLPYELRMERQVTTKQQAALYETEARQLARDLNIVWAYVAVVPLFPRHFMVRPSEPPDGWHTNFKKLKSTRPIKPRSPRAIASPGPAAGFRIDMKYPRPSEYKVHLPFMPLRRALDAVQAYRTAHENIRYLMDLHFNAIDQLGMVSQLILYAKAFDLARDMLVVHGNVVHGNKDKQLALPAKVRAALRRSLNWLGEMCNELIETRHVFSEGKLLPKMSPTEGTDFVHDADLVIRGVVEKQLEIGAFIQEKETYNTSYEAEASPTGP